MKRKIPKENEIEVKRIKRETKTKIEKVIKGKGKYNNINPEKGKYNRQKTAGSSLWVS